MKTGQQTLFNPQGRVDVEAWLQKLTTIYGGVSESKWAELQTQLQTVLGLGEGALTEWGESAFEISLKMAVVLSDVNADLDALTAALWFPIVMNGLISREDLPKKTSKVVAHLVFGALDLKVSTAFSGLLGKDLAQLDRLRKMFLTMVNDARVVLVKLAERVVAMRLSKKLDPKRQKPLAESALYIYAPLANRLGIGTLKWELEDRAFAILEPQSYQQITEKLDEKRIDREQYIDAFLKKIRADLAEMGVIGEASGRVKHLYSIFRKMHQKHLSFDRLFDLRAIRILVKDVQSCYVVLSYLHETYEPILSEFTDYIAQPKPNGYRSIHTVIEGPLGKSVEIQIRTFAMHEASEMGVAAHWRYKEGVSHDSHYEARILWLRSLLDWQDHLGEKPEAEISADQIARKALLESIRDAHIYVFTPQGDVLDLDTGATPVDFAYRVHTEVGHRCRGAKVNGRIVPLTYELRTGDRVEILTAKESRPSRDWLRAAAGFVKTSAARQKISLWFRQQMPKESKSVEAKAEQKSTQTLTNREIKKPHSNADLMIEGENNLLFKMAGCCHPILGDAVEGYITQGRGISVHREDCPSLAYLKEKHLERLVSVTWGEGKKGQYAVELRLEAVHRPALLKEITQVLLSEELSILNMQFHLDSSADLVRVGLSFFVQEKTQLNRVINLLMRLPKMIKVERV